MARRKTVEQIRSDLTQPPWAELLAMPLPDLCQHIRRNMRSMFDATAEDPPEERDRQLAFLRDVSSQLDVIETRVLALTEDERGNSQ